MKKIRAFWQSLWVDVDRRVRLGRILGLAFVAGGFIVIAKAWDGAANHYRVDSQFPYLLSGGFLGLGLILTGCTLLVLASVRAERQVQSKQFDEMTTLLSRNLGRLTFSSNGNGSGTNSTTVIAGADAYHRETCTIVKGKSGLTQITVGQAAAEGLVPCRACDPPRATEFSKDTSALTSGGQENL